MNPGWNIVAAVTLIAGLGLAPTAATAACNVRNPTACTAESQPQAEATQPPTEAPPAQPEAASVQTEAAAKPLQLKRYMRLGPARRSVSRSGKHHVAGNRSRRRTARASRKTSPKVSAAASAKAGAAPLTPKAIPTISISARALALAPTTDQHAVGFTAETAPWSDENALASADEPETLPSGVTIARFDELNDIDRAADPANASEPVVKSDSLTGVSLVTSANAAPTPQAAKPKPQASWWSWVYSKVVAAITAIRSIFV